MAQTRVLVVEDEGIVAEGIVSSLEDLGYVVSGVVGVAEEAVRQAGELQPDVVLMDVRLPGRMDGVEAAEQIQSRFDIPVIYLSAYSEDEMLRRAGPTQPAGYILKPFDVRTLHTTIQMALYKHQIDRRYAHRMAQVMAVVPEGMVLLDTGGRVLLANPVGAEYLHALANVDVGGTVTQLGGRPLDDLVQPLPHGVSHTLKAAAPSVLEFDLVTRPVAAEGGPAGWVLVIRDVTREREIQRYAEQQERLAAVGQLASGIAHDFNNIMTVITMYAQLSQRMPNLPERLYERLRVIDEQGLEASKLIGQILDFSRQGNLEPRPMDLLMFLKEQVKLLSRALPENIAIDIRHENEEYVVNADPTRIQQVMMNLAINARDAMPDGGRLRVALERRGCNVEASFPVPEAPSQEWVCVSVLDTGAGIPPEALPHVFEPFFSTEGLSKEAVLNLSQIYGIVTSHAGHVGITSVVGEGTTCTFCLPALSLRKPEPAALGMAAPLLKGQGELVLVVEDDFATRRALASSLDYLGYQVLQAANGREALAAFERNAERIAMVLSDIVMPEMGGAALLRELRRRGVAVKVVLVSGHPLTEELSELKSLGLSDWLLKPIGLGQLAEMVYRVVKQE
ncbi:MAG: response regulator [Anaerolineae bacterium]|nr:response regulator [Anaerolineae bacterium]